MNGTIKQIRRTNGDIRWRVTVPNGRGGSRRKEFLSGKLAGEYLSRWRKDQATQGKVFSSLTETEQSVLIAAYWRSVDGNYNLLDAVTHHEKHLTDLVSNQRLLDEALSEYITDCVKRGLKKRSVDSNQNAIQPFVALHPQLTVDDVNDQHLSEFIASKPEWSARSVNNFVVRIGSFFRWCVDRGWSNSVPIKKSHKRMVEYTSPDVWSVDEIDRILKTAYRIDKATAALLAVQIFAGLRPAEAQERDRSGFDSVDFEAGELWVLGKVARKKRIVKISPNLKAWLEASGDWRQENVRGYLDHVREKSGVRWSHDITRHSFASYHLAFHEDAAKTAFEMGHSGNSQVLWQHYRNVVRKADAERFWNILPPLHGTDSENKLNHTTR